MLLTIFARIFAGRITVPVPRGYPEFFGIARDMGGAVLHFLSDRVNIRCSMEEHNHYMDQAFAEAFRSVKNNIGGPFGALVVREGKIIGRGVNSVSSLNDPTAHAEVMAIRDACRNVNHFDLSGADLYSTCEPCPMCLSAIYWSNIRHVYYCSDRYEAAGIGFRDNHIYEELNLPPGRRSLCFSRLENSKGKELFSLWTEKTDKTLY